MFRNTRQLSEANRSARPFLELTVDGDDGCTWSFWAMAPHVRPGVEAVWLTNGEEFMAVGIDRTTGDRVPLNGAEPLGTADLAPGGADDRVAATARVLPRRSPGCTCPACGSTSERAAALAQYATGAAERK